MGRSATTPTTRKRTRLQNDEEQSSTAKKRRLQRSEDSRTADAGLDGKIEPQSVINGTLRRPRGKSAIQDAEDPSPDTRDAPGSDPSARPQPKQLPHSRKDQRQRGRGRALTNTQTASVYDVPDSDEDELSAAGVTPHPNRRQAAPEAPAAGGAGPGLATGGAGPGKKRRGRPSKRDREAQAKGSSAPSTSGQPSQPPGQHVDGDTSAQGSDAVHDSPKRKTRLGPGKSVNGPSEEDVEVPKGILTPQNRKARLGRLPKSVVFDDAFVGEDLDSLADVTPSRSYKKRNRAAQEAKDETEVDGALEHKQQASDYGSDGEDEDDEVCAICSKPDSEPPNEIVFCDNCDMPVHQKCYGLTEIPEGDWICRNCSQDDVDSANRGGASLAQPPVVARGDRRPDIPNFDQHLRSAQRVLLDRCAGRRRIKLRGLDEAYKKAYQLVEQTVVAGEGNSMLVIGARGCGKTTLVESIIDDISGHHKDQFHVVRLSGFIHTDDKLALREIWRQLGKEMDVEDELVNKTTNYADTMASLLALLAHPSEIAETQDGVTSSSIVFVIDEFDLFATHARQTLLYNLFDIAQARKAPIAVLGLTTRIDVVESLEKRVKSRFSHRYVYLSLPKSLPAFWDVCRQGLSIDGEDMAREGIDTKLAGHRAFWNWWNGNIETLYKSPVFVDQLERHFYSTKSVSAFLTTCILPLAALSPVAPSLQIPSPAAGFDVSLEPADSKLHLLGSLSDLDLAMLIAAARLDIVAHTDTVNFAMAYDEYTSLMSRQRVQSAGSGMLALGGGARIWGRGTAGSAWERLAALGLLVPAAAGGRGTAGLGGLDAKMWKVDVALEEIPAAVKLNAVLARWCREI